MGAVIARQGGLPSLPRLETSFRPDVSRYSSFFGHGYPPRARFSRSPKFRANANCLFVGDILIAEQQHGVILSMPALDIAASCGVSGILKSTPEASPKKWRGEACRIVTVMVAFPPDREMRLFRFFVLEKTTL